MKLSTKNILRLSLTFNVILAVTLIVIFSQLNELKNINRVSEFRSEILELELNNAKRLAQEQMELANRSLIRARVSSQKALANQFYANYQAQQATKYVNLIELYEQKYPSDNLKGLR